MQSKLTLRIDSKLIEGAKQVAEQRHTSLSRLVADYFDALLQRGPTGELDSLPPRTRALIGSLRGKGEVADEADHRDFLERKYS